MMITMAKKIYHCGFSSPIGIIRVAWTTKGVCFVGLAQVSESEFRGQIELRFGMGAPVRDVSAMRDVEAAFHAYFDHKQRWFDLPVDILSGTSFQRRVWRLLQGIPFGTTRSYKWIAEAMDMPMACRAVGNSNGKNPIPIILPCHRVVRADGGLGGFSSGVEIKRKLLLHEGVRVDV